MKKITHDQDVNRTLADRRKLMDRRILIGRILVGVWAAATVLNLIFLMGSAALRSYLSCTMADLLLMLRYIYAESAVTRFTALPAAVIPCFMVLTAVFWKKDFASILRRAVFILLWLDVIVGVWGYFVDPALLFGVGSNHTFVALANLALHLFLIWHISRARRAMISLDVLPVSEIEGDPFEEFRKKDDGARDESEKY